MNSIGISEPTSSYYCCNSSSTAAPLKFTTSTALRTGETVTMAAVNSGDTLPVLSSDGVSEKLAPADIFISQVSLAAANGAPATVKEESEYSTNKVVSNYSQAVNLYDTACNLEDDSEELAPLTIPQTCKTPIQTIHDKYLPPFGFTMAAEVGQGNSLHTTATTGKKKRKK